MNGQSAEGFQGMETILYDTVVVGACHSLSICPNA